MAWKRPDPRRHPYTTQALSNNNSTEPAYNANSSGTRMPPPQGQTMQEENALSMLEKYDTVIIVDDSTSMRGQRWTETREALAMLAEKAAAYDSDGIDIHFINSDDVGSNIRDRASVLALFDTVSPAGLTQTGEKLEQLLSPYLEKIEQAQKQDRLNAGGLGGRSALKAIKPLNLVVLTDGQPTDEPEPVIIAAAKRLDEGRFPQSQVGISFVQIGNDPQATKALKELDDALEAKHNIRDMVDTTPYSGPSQEQDGEVIMKMLLGGVNRRFDKKPTSHA